jgi:hypothetical protein
LKGDLKMDKAPICKDCKREMSIHHSSEKEIPYIHMTSGKQIQKTEITITYHCNYADCKMMKCYQT